MARIAALYDIHGNLPALEAVLDDLARSSVDVVVVGGDFLWGPMPRQTLDRLRGIDLETIFLRGNTEREVYTREAGKYEAMNRWCADQLSEADLELMSSLPLKVSVDADGVGSALFCHASPRRDDEAITAATTADRLHEMWPEGPEQVLVCGHTHAQFDRSVDARRVVNPGSIGMPFGEPGAYWALIGPEVDLRHTTYDLDAAAEAFRRSGMPDIESLIEILTSPLPASTAAERFTT